jgi:hypothetical protein
MYIPTKDELDKLPPLQAEAERLEGILAEAKTAKKKLKAVNESVRLILKGPVKKRGPRKAKVKPATHTLPGLTPNEGDNQPPTDGTA